MSLDHPGVLPAPFTFLDRLAAAFAQSCRRVFQTVAGRRGQLHRESLEPACMSRIHLAEELLAPCPRFTPREVGEAASVGVAPPTGTHAQAVLMRRLAIARELLCRDLRAQLQDQPAMAAPELLIDMLRLHCAGLDYEVFLVVYLSTHRRVIAIEELFRGTLTQTAVYPREVVKGAIAHRADAVAFAHNHPQGDAEPSAADKCLTQRLQQALGLIDVRVLDHFIVAGPAHFSFAQKGLI